MALTPTRLEYRLTLSNVDRARERTETVIVARHPSETPAHATLRMLAYGLLHEDGLAFGPGLSAPDTADLWTHDLTGRLTTWVECGNADAAKLRKVQQHNSGATLHIVMDDARRAAELTGEIAATRLPRGSADPHLWLIDGTLVAALAAVDERRQKWTLTIVGDHLYLDVDGKNFDGAVTRATLAAT